MAELRFKPRVCHSQLFYYTMMSKYQRTTKKKMLQYVWGLWEGSLVEAEFKLGLEEWIVLCPTDPEEKKAPGGRII